MATDDHPGAGRGQPELPAVFGRYRVKRKLGGGGMGSVYLVENTELQREEALKVPHFDPVEARQARERFLREARAAAKLHHPNLCPVHHVGVQDGVYFLTMHYLQGRPLSDYTRKPQPPRQAVEIVLKLTQALDYAHGQGVVHRDLKPSNIMMCAGVGPVVLDFGLAKQLQSADRKLTQTGAVLGTPGYMSPEQVQGLAERVGPASDVYSLGVILYELLTGQLLFNGTSLAEVLGKILYGQPPPPSQRRPGLDPVLDTLCLRALAKAPEQRYPSMKAFGAALMEYLRAAPATAGTVQVTPGQGQQPQALQAATVLSSQAGVPPRPVAAGGTPRPERPWLVPLGLLGCLGVLLVAGLIGLGVAGIVALSRGNRPALLDCTGPEGVSAEAVKPAQVAWARYLGRAVEEEDEVAPGVKMKFVLVPPGKFLMGWAREQDRSPDELQHEVTLTQPFYLGKYEVTQAQYEAVLGPAKNQSHFRRADLPVENVSWDEATSYAENLTNKRSDGLLYRLPTEAEWEYSCRGGRSSSKPFGIGDGTSLSLDLANFGNALQKTSPVGSYPANAFSLHDMHGNVWEWCADRYGPYPAGNVTNPVGPAEGSYRVYRGGGWSGNEWSCRATSRGRFELGVRSGGVGARLARVPSGAGK